MQALPQMSLASSFFASYGLPQVVAEHRFAAPRRWRFDFAWPNEKVALEVDGGLWIRGRHARASGIVKEHEKFNEAACLGWRVLRVQPKELLSQRTIELIRRALKP